jgi:hypothetical protein
MAHDALQNPKASPMPMISPASVKLFAILRPYLSEYRMIGGWTTPLFASAGQYRGEDSCLAEKETVNWAETESEVLHYSKIARECLKAMTALRPYLTVILWDRTLVQGWLESITQGCNAGEDISLVPTSWYGSIMLQNDGCKIELDFLDIETVYASSPPLKLIDQSDTAYRLKRGE